MQDELFMQIVLDLVRNGIGSVSPNPLVGVVLVKNGVIIGQGFHERAGQNHAEINAIISCDQEISGATLYCNLEPCCHTNKQTPPCAPHLRMLPLHGCRVRFKFL